MFLFLLTTTRRYDIMQKYRGNVACTLLSCRRSGMTASPCNKELCGRYLFPRVRSKFSAMFSAHQALHPSRLKRRAMTGFFSCTLF